MKAFLLSLLVCVVVLALTEAAGTRYRYRSSRSRYNRDRYNRYDRYNRNEDKKDEVKEEKEEEVVETPAEAPRDNSEKRKKDSKPRVHPCAEVKCEVGQECDVDEESGKGMCQCVTECPYEEGPRVQVCTSRNVTFANECEFHRMKCLCQSRDEQCERHRYKNAHLDYYGECTEIKDCKEHEMQEFPKRMRDWLYLIMEELDNRNTLSAPEHDMVMEAKRHSKKWVLPVIWKFCDLDKTHDRSITKEELLSITAPLKPLEHCTGPFLEKCDSNDNGIITLAEWGNCLGLDEDEVRKGDRCDLIRQG